MKVKLEQNMTDVQHLPVQIKYVGKENRKTDNRRIYKLFAEVIKRLETEELENEDSSTN